MLSFTNGFLSECALRFGCLLVVSELGLIGHQKSRRRRDQNGEAASAATARHKSKPGATTAGEDPRVTSPVVQLCRANRRRHVVSSARACRRRGFERRLPPPSCLLSLAAFSPPHSPPFHDHLSHPLARHVSSHPSITAKVIRSSTLFAAPGGPGRLTTAPRHLSPSPPLSPPPTNHHHHQLVPHPCDLE